MRNAVIYRRRFLTLMFAVVSATASPHMLADPNAERLAAAAMQRTEYKIRYDGSYHRLTYPNGDVPSDIGVCTDLVIRSYRVLNIDLQRLVHEDMIANFSEYPSRRIWGMDVADKNIDHRRVPNLRTFFARHGQALPVSSVWQDYKPGDLVTWTLAGNLPHIGIVSSQVDAESGRPLIVHNIGAGPVLEDMIDNYFISGHYRFMPAVYD